MWLFLFKKRCLEQRKIRVNILLQTTRERERQTDRDREKGACKPGAIIFSNLLMAAEDHFQPSGKGLSANDLSTMKTTTQITEREVYSSIVRHGHNWHFPFINIKMPTTEKLKRILLGHNKLTMAQIVLAILSNNRHIVMHVQRQPRE